MSRACPACREALPEGQRFCGACGTDTGAAGATARATQTSVPSAPLDASEIAARFSAGTVIAGRYRIVGLLGRGGMGEVYRADDLKLARPVALKFLPEQVERDPSRLNRLLNEVRTALSVSHPNVCRVHDVHQEAGQHFITMEFVDGDDLSSLLRRIGRLPSDKALEISRQLCAGLGAAHSAGVLHRDLKPANIMIDGRGQVKITDFGLAGLAGGFEGAEVTAGTPAYMAPEQLSGKGVTEASDLYSLGLVLYEIYTGKPAHEGGSPAEIARKRLSSAPTSPSSHVTDIDPAVERVILRCLERDPADRPPSALAISAALPGGDPLAAALAAGETPAPELVAEAGAAGGLVPAKAWALLGAFAVLTALSIAGSERYNAVSRADLPRSVAVLREDARRILTSLGYGETPAVDSVVDFDLHWDYLRHIGDVRKPDPMAPAAHRQPAGIWFGYRQSPGVLLFESSGSIGDWISRSHPTTPGEIRLKLDPTGRLIWLDVVPPERLEPRAGAETDWGALLAAAGFDPLVLTDVEPEWTPPRGSDERRAWEGVYPDAPEIPVRIEAAAMTGRPVAFRIVEPWTEPLETAEPPALGGAPVLGAALNMLTLLAAAFLAWRNVRLGRGDRRTALRFALAIGAIRMMWYVFTHHVPAASETASFTGHLAWSLYRFGRAYVVYLAVEPYARKLWPRMLTSWVRLFDGRFRDPLVGRDVLIGLTVGAALAAAIGLTAFMRERFDLRLVDILNTAGPNFYSWATEALRGLPGSLLALFGGITTQIDGVFMIAIVVLVSRIIVRRDVLTLVPLAVLIVLFSLGGGPGALVVGLLFLATIWLTLLRTGLLAFVVFYISGFFFSEYPLTYDLTAWWAAPSWIAMVSLLLLAGWSFQVALAGQPIFRDRILEE